MPPYRFGYLQLVTAAPLEPERGRCSKYDPIDASWKDKSGSATTCGCSIAPQILLTVLRDVAPGRLTSSCGATKTRLAVVAAGARTFMALVEGWPLYSAQLAIELLPKGTARDRVQLLLWRHRMVPAGPAHRCLRLHQNGSGQPVPSQRIDDAFHFFVDDCYLDEHAAARG